MPIRARLFPVLAAAALLVPAPASAALFPGFPAPVAEPRVPVSLLARPFSWFDPSRLQMGSTVSVGSGFGGTTEGLQVTSFTYRFRSPLLMRVNVGNAFGAGRGDGRFFLEGLDLQWRPSRTTFLQVQFRDVRSPLQRSRDPYGIDPGERGF